MAGRSRARAVAILVLAVLAAGGGLWWWLATRAAAGEAKTVTYPDMTNDDLRVEFQMLRWERRGDDLIVHGVERTVPVEGGEDAAWYDAGAIFHNYFAMPSYRDWPDDNPLLRTLGDRGLLPPTDVQAGKRPAPPPEVLEAYRQIGSISEETLPEKAHTDAGTLAGIAIHYVEHRTIEDIRPQLEQMSPKELAAVIEYFERFRPNPLFEALIGELQAVRREMVGDTP